MTVLLGATFALLLAAVVLSFQGMKSGVAKAPQKEIARLQSQLEQIRREQDRLAMEKQIQDVRSQPITEIAGPSDLQKMRADLAAKELELARLAEEKADAVKKADTYRDEAGLIGQRELEKNDSELRRSRQIKNALLIGKIKEYVTDQQMGDFMTIEVLMSEQVQPDTILAIRRNTGILGQVKVSEVTYEGAVASPMPGFGPINPKPGDELIIPPQF